MTHTNTLTPSRLKFLGASFFALLSLFVLQNMLVVQGQGPALTALLLPKSVTSSGRAVAPSLQVTRKELTNAEKRRKARVGLPPSSAPTMSVSVIGIRSVQKKPTTARPTIILEKQSNLSTGAIKAKCGDNLITGSEKCDDGNSVSGDGCSSTCATVEPGYECFGQPSICRSFCGDGLLAKVEWCDDGNGVGGDGCTATCAVEALWECTGSAGDISTCTQAGICGDGILQDDEGCDDGNSRNNDGCSVECETEE